ncbi:tetratricopeptide repeat protein [Algoriphagus sp. AGSA1]|uniref:tetratricopeptide repeat protein n=1 Tax=Algoriphagus sp. AGSA1 TaxID=2907213 RepID=UPI001F16179D|nr:tetratricopeptide repeat protein [Algoriphagus sp. AGSA1]MCE7054155.1 tetratricopeptide repeat protein [Algoriphagus sp. AGSA1]
MKKLVLIFLMLGIGAEISFAQHNKELQEMADQDQQSRFSGNIDWAELAREDSLRRERVLELMRSDSLVTGKDYFNAGIIFQHGNDTTASSLAVKCFGKAIEMDPTLHKWWYAAAVDRDLMRRGEPQIYGTQYIQDESTGGKLKQYQIDTTQVTDEDRIYYGVETLAQQREKERLMNLKSLGSFYASSGSIEKTLELITLEFDKGNDAEYNVREEAINSFGYQLLSQQKLQEAIQILELNTRLYPSGANTFDSLGEALRLDGRIEESIRAYSKSLELNPENENAKTAIREMGASTDPQ